MAYCVYIHTNKSNGKKYIGITSQNVSRRWRNGNGYYLNEHFSRAIEKYGWDGFSHEIVKAGLSKADACLLEMQLIAEYKANDWHYGYNGSAGGEYPAAGLVHSPETRKKMSEAHKGRKVSAEGRRNMSIAAKKRGNGMTGKVGSECKKTGLVKQIDIQTGEVLRTFWGCYEAARETGFSKSSIQRAAKGERRQAGGFKWEYIPRREIDGTF